MKRKRKLPCKRKQNPKRFRKVIDDDEEESTQSSFSEEDFQGDDLLPDEEEEFPNNSPLPNDVKSKGKTNSKEIARQPSSNSNETIKSSNITRQYFDEEADDEDKALDNENEAGEEANSDDEGFLTTSSVSSEEFDESLVISKIDIDTSDEVLRYRLR